MNTAIFVGVTATYALFWIKYKMRQALFEAESIEQALTN
jgi:hypothetical protein